MADWTAQLTDSLNAWQLGAADRLSGPLASFIRLLEKWNTAYNLTAVRDPAQMVPRHILDSLVVAPHIRGPLLDVGTGPGLPGIPLALADPDLAVTLLDSNIKKTRFCRQAATELKLSNIDIVHSRVEDYRPEGGFATVISRAYASLADYAASTRHLLANGGRLLAMKGEYPHDEIHALPEWASVVAVHPLEVPGLSAQRHLVEMALD